MKRVAYFGKVDYEGAGSNRNTVEVEVKLEDGRLSICGGIWNSRHTDYLSCGQNLETILSLIPSDKRLQSIVRVWRRWHLNDMKAGSPRQERWLREHPIGAVYPKSHYEEACKALAAVGLNPDTEYLHEGKPYSYGSAWLKETLPAEVIAEVENWFVPVSADVQTSQAANCRRGTAN